MPQTEQPETCPQCGVIVSKLKTAVEKRRNEGYSGTKKKSTFSTSDKRVGIGLAVITVLFLFYIIVVLPSAPPPSGGGEIRGFDVSRSDCYSIGFQYGKCAGMAMLGHECPPEEDVVVPERCRNNKHTKIGITDGLKAVNEMLNQ